MTIHARLASLSSPLRTRILRLLELEELAVGEVARVLQLPQSTVSRHLKELEDAGWIASRKDGPTRLLALSGDLDPEGRDLWQVVRAGTDGDHPEDGLRLASVLAAREGDGRQFFGRVAGQWAEVRRELFGDVFLTPTLLALLPPDLVVADLGCGTGEVLELLSPVARQVIGVDREPAMLRAARRRTADLPNVALRAGEIDAPPLADREVDAALCMLVLHHVQAPAAVFVAAARALRPGGRLVVLDMVAHDRTAYRRTMGHVHLGFEQRELVGHAEAAGLRCLSWRVLPPAPEAAGPALFLARFAVAADAAPRL